MRNSSAFLLLAAALQGRAQAPAQRLARLLLRPWFPRSQSLQRVQSGLAVTHSAGIEFVAPDTRNHSLAFKLFESTSAGACAGGFRPV